MLFRFFTALATPLLLLACASAPQTERLAFASSAHDLLGLDDLSRVSILQKFSFRQATLDVSDTPLNASTDTKLSQHESIAGNLSASEKSFRNIEGKEATASYFVRTQNALPPAGWSDVDNRYTHLESGLGCPYGIQISEDTRVFVLERLLQFDDIGRDVGCHYVANDNSDMITVFASYWPEITLEDHAANAGAAIYQTFDVQGPASVSIASPQAGDESAEVAALLDGIEEPIAGGFDIGERNGVSYKTSIWLVKTFGWHVKLRATYPSADQTAEMLSAIHFMASHLSVRAKNLEEPIAPGVEV
ncbi:hypothetical protein PUV54_14045 [Hyphococcus flavus]|uniref:Uncharacterized protein n=1 Tax=Hyphococcus flavus TaxID=1866326 RepID=A0AAE9ZAZ7_9PROT|nr:hypothetical protein [Hyphococcus flavus]WDI31073.1 hypothetical protein PUV54_14045 [Hyphococcus flavus]